MGEEELMLEKIGFDLFGFGANVLTKTWDLQRTYDWQLFLPHTIGGVPGFSVSQYCQGVGFDDYSTETDKIRYGAEERGYTGDRKIDAVTLVFVVPTNQHVFNYFAAWSALKVDSKGFFNPKSIYKKNIYIVLHDSAGIETNRFTLKGCFPLNKQGFKGAYDDENIQRMSYRISVDTISPGSLISQIGSLVRTGIGLSKLF